MHRSGHVAELSKESTEAERNQDLEDWRSPAPRPPQDRTSAAQKLDCLIGLSADYYWELDRQFRLSEILHGDEREQTQASSLLLGKARWDAGGTPISCSWAEHKATLESHQPFSDLVVEWTKPDGSKRYMKSSGRPRFAPSGGFLGYAGITRDVTQEIVRERLDGLEVTLARFIVDSSAELDIPKLLRIVRENTGCAFGRYWSREGSSATMSIRHSVGTAEEAYSDVSRDHGAPVTDKGEGIIGQLWQSEQAVWIGNIFPSAGENSADQSGLTALVALRDSRMTLGILEFRALPRQAPTDRLYAVFSQLAAQIRSLRERDKILRELRESERRFAGTVELAAIGICHVGLDGRIIQVNQRMTEMLGYSKDELLERTVSDLSHPDERDATSRYLDPLRKGEIDSFQVEKRYLHKNGRPVWVRINSVMNRDDAGNPLHHISVVEDISDKKAAEEKVQYLATHDGLTGLPNRPVFNELLASTVRRSARQEMGICAVLFIDLDRFKSVNDSLGHEAGDVLLKTAAERIVRCVRSSDCVARFGGDEFVVLLDGLASAVDAEVIGAKILSSLQSPIRIRKHMCRSTASIGIAVYPDDGKDADALLRSADIAMYAAKEGGRNEMVRYSTDMTTMSVRQISLEKHLTQGLERNEFRIYCQPKADAGTLRITGVEFLLRWWNAELGTVSPAQFLPVADETGLIIPIGRWAIGRACRQLVDWQKRQIGSISISVNVSPAQFADTGFFPFLKETLIETRMPPERLELEIPEAALLSDFSACLAFSKAVHELGLGLVVDDVGAEHSSLDHLKRIAPDTLKIDRARVRDIDRSPRDRKIVEKVIAWGATLNAKVVAKNVETEEQRATLSELGCNELQGFLIGKPCHPDKVVRLLRR